MQSSSKTRGKKRSINTKRSSGNKKPSFLRLSLKYLPALLILTAAFLLHTPPIIRNNIGVTSNVLSYATNVSNNDLLTQTNNQRAQNGVGSLTLNSQLNAAAQAKANDMVARNYWAHVTPDGEQPWAFMDRAGYSYTSAGENLAYGFDSSADTVTGWMNSPPHKENLLKSTFLDVGFGTANSENFVDSGQQTIIVAMYGAQNNQVAAAPVSQSTAPAAKVQANQSVAQSPTPEPVAEPIAPAEPPVPPTAVATPVAAKEITPKAENINTLATTSSAVQVKRVQVLTGGNARWSSTLMVLSIFAVVVLWMLQRGFEVKRLILNGENFFLHHMHIDLTVISFLVLGYSLLQTTGTIR